MDKESKKELIKMMYADALIYVSRRKPKQAVGSFIQKVKNEKSLPELTEAENSWALAIMGMRDDAQGAIDFMESVVGRILRSVETNGETRCAFCGTALEITEVISCKACGETHCMTCWDQNSHDCKEIGV